MKLIGALAALSVLVVIHAEAQPRTVLGRMTCAEAATAVKRAGDIVLGTGSGASERLVRDRSFCDISEIAELRFLPTRDNPQCPVGYRCKEPDYDIWNWE